MIRQTEWITGNVQFRVFNLFQCLLLVKFNLSLPIEDKEDSQFSEITNCEEISTLVLQVMSFL